MNDSELQKERSDYAILLELYEHLKATLEASKRRCEELERLYLDEKLKSG